MGCIGIGLTPTAVPAVPKRAACDSAKGIMTSHDKFPITLEACCDANAT